MALARLCDAASQVSAHYLVEEDGQVFQLVDESKRAWHAGKGAWGEVTDVNSASIGIEIVNPGHEFGYRPFPQAQMQAVLALSQGIIARHQIAPCDVIGHSDIAPTRKEDPGELFPWDWLAQQGVGVSCELRIASCERSPEEMLHDYGYRWTDAAELPAVITAFQRHFRPQRLSGVWDDECASILASLLAMR